jgi:hypothetical protein
MANITYPIFFTNNGAPATGLTPAATTHKTLAGATVSAPTITELGGGFYTFPWDSEANAEAAFVFDGGSTLTNPGERYVPVACTKNDGRIQDPWNLSIKGQTLSLTPTVGTVEEAMLAARAAAFGKWAISGTTLTIYGSDGTTIVRAFTLDSATAPTSRT